MDDETQKVSYMDVLEEHPKVKRLRRKMKKKLKLEKEKHKKMKNKLPDHIIALPCADKKFQEKWYKGRNWLNIPHSTRMILCGPPSSGKSTSIKNIILRSDPPFESIQVVHYSAHDSKEWDDVGAEMLSELPHSDDIPPEGKKLLILEDLDMANMCKEDKSKLNRLMGYCSSHKSLSIYINSQNPIDIAPPIRRMTNVFILYSQADLIALTLMASRTGMRKEDFLTIFEKFVKNKHDSLWIDLTANSPARYRINGYTKIQKIGKNKTADWVEV